MFNCILQELRLDAGLTQEDLADKFNISRSVLSKYETGENEPSYEFLIQCCKFFNVSADYLLGITRIRTSPNTLYNFRNYDDDSLKKVNEILIYLKDNKKYIKYVHTMLTEIEKIK